MFDMIFSLTGGCPESHYCPLGTTDPIACPAGTYNDLTHQKICKSCEPGYYCVANSTTYLSTPCPTGKKKVEEWNHMPYFRYPYQILQILWAWGSGIVPHGQMLKNVRLNYTCIWVRFFVNIWQLNISRFLLPQWYETCHRTFMSSRNLQQQNRGQQWIWLSPLYRQVLWVFPVSFWSSL